MNNRPSLLFMSQRLPFPPNKGEKITSFNIVKHLAERFDIHVGTFADAEDMREVDRFRSFCSSLYVEPIDKPRAWIMAIWRWLGGLPISFALFRSAGLRRYVSEVVKKHQPVAIVTHSSNISEYALVPTAHKTLRVLHFADVDSEKFAAYALRAPVWKRWLYRLEASRVRAAEIRLAAHVDAIAFVSDEEANLFRAMVDAPRARIVTIANGVDSEAFNPDKLWSQPSWGNGPVFVFTGAMDYRPNIDAVLWFADFVLPNIRAVHDHVKFAIVGSNPSPAVQALASRPGILVTGRVPEVQPYLAHALAAIAPLQIARGIQNKVLEALAMGRPTIVTTEALTGIGTPNGTPVIVANGADEWIAATLQLLDDPAYASSLAARARPFVLDNFAWSAQLRTLDTLLDSARPQQLP